MKKMFLLFVLMNSVSCSPESSQNTLKFLKKVQWLKSTHSYGSSCIRFITGNKTIYVDPVKICTADNPKADFIFITHEHDDHFDRATIKSLLKDDTVVVIPDYMDYETNNTVKMKNGDTVNFPSISVTALEMSGPSHKRGNGYVFSTEGLKIYVSGDTAINRDNSELKGIDLVFANLKPPYMWDAEELASWAKETGPAVLVPIHYTDNEKPEVEKLKRLLKNRTRIIQIEPLSQPAQLYEK